MSTEQLAAHPKYGNVSARLAPFAHSMHAERVAEDLFLAEVSERWNVLRGPNGGYLAALLLATLQRRLGDDTRRPRVLSLHYPKVPAVGQVEIRTQLTRAGRSMSWLSAELWQNDELCVAARAAFSGEWPSIEYNHVNPPVLPEGAQSAPAMDGLPPFAQNYIYRSLFATPMASGGHDAVGGYIRLREPEPYSAPLMAALTDAWFPSTFAYERRPSMAATLDLTVHFRDYEALEHLDATSEVLSMFRSRLATEGFFEEDGELWSPSGKLLVQSRQLAIAAPYGTSISKR
ncbi:MAG TPA: thioesterase family protein [Polyangiales bacterium]|nr:thioesterase family protein [Polyangiales bacterium]